MGSGLFQLLDYLDRQTDRKNMGAASSPQRNSLIGYSDMNDGDNPKTGLTDGRNQVYDAQGNPVADAKLIAQYNQAKQGGWLNSPFVPLTSAQANANPQMANTVAQWNNNDFLSQQKTGETIADRESQLGALARQHNLALGLSPDDAQGIAAVQAGGSGQLIGGVNPDINTVNLRAGRNYQSGAPLLGSMADIASMRAGLSTAQAGASAAENLARNVQPNLNQIATLNSRSGLLGAQGGLERAPQMELNKNWIVNNLDPASMTSEYVKNRYLGLGSGANNTIDTMSGLVGKNDLRPLTPQEVEMQQLNDLMHKGGAATTSSGATYAKPASVAGRSGISVPPLSYSTDGSGRLLDASTGQHVPEASTQTEKAKKEEDAKKARLDHATSVHDSEIARLTAKQKELKEEQKKLIAEHHNPNSVVGMYQGLKGWQQDNRNAIKGLIGQGQEAVGNAAGSLYANQLDPFYRKYILGQ